MPSITRQNIVEVEMSDYQIPIYAEARRNEIRQETQNKKTKKAQILGNLYSETTSTYRIFSRAFCNFVFPSGMTRPLPFRSMGEALTNAEGNAPIIDEAYMDPVNEETKKLNLEGKYDDLPNDESLGENQSMSYSQSIINVLDTLDRRKNELFTPESLLDISPKFLACLQNINNPEYDGNHLLYSQFRTLEGIGIFKYVLEANGYVELSLRKKNVTVNDITENKYVLNIPEDKLHLPKFALYTGTETDEEKEIIRNIFNSNWSNFSEPLLSQLRSLGDNNFNGDICKLLMITSSGAEGINLKNVRYVHIMEPYWHPVRIQQVIGRARRICSHRDLPIEKQTIETFLYIIKFTANQIASKEYKEITANDKNITSDERLLQIMDNKTRINHSLIEILKETSIDCTLHHVGKTQTCFRLPVSDKKTNLTKPDFYERSGETKTVTQQKTYKTITIKGKKYILYENDDIIEEEPFTSRQEVIIIGKKVKGKDGKIGVKLYKK